MAKGAGPLSRPFLLARVSPGGTDVVVEATAQERAGLAVDLGLLALRRLEGRFRVAGTIDRVRVTGRVTADLDQICVISLDPFSTELTEDVTLDYERPDPRRPVSADADGDPLGDDPPEELVGDRIDLGTLMAEFLALGLDPYPRKPGVEFAGSDDRDEADSPFAQLAGLRDRDSANS